LTSFCFGSEGLDGVTGATAAAGAGGGAATGSGAGAGGGGGVSSSGTLTLVSRLVTSCTGACKSMVPSA